MGKFREVRRINLDKVKKYCDFFHFYEKGNYSDLSNLLNSCTASFVDVSCLETIATDIFNHSSKDSLSVYESPTGFSKSFTVACIMTDLINDCCYSTIISKGV